MELKPLLSEVDAQRVLRCALQNGGEFADLFAEERVSTLIEIEAERVERLIQGTRAGAGVRVLHSHRTSYSYTDLVREADLLECAEIARLAVKKNNPMATVIPGERGWEQRRLPALKRSSSFTLAEKLELLWRVERAARRVDRRICQVLVRYADLQRRIAVANSLGEHKEDEVTYLVLAVRVVASNAHDLQTAYESAGGVDGLELLTESFLEELALRTAQRALRNLEARPAPSGMMTVVLTAEAGGTMIHEAVGHGLEADLADEGLSVYQQRLGEKIASPLITVIDDATLPGKRGSFSFDDEGVPGQRTVLVENGILKTYLYDRRMAMKSGQTSTGNGRRESYAFPPIVRMSNTFIAPGESAPEEVIRSVERGLLVKRMGGGEVNPVNGDFVFEVEEGWLIEKGAPVEPVRGATLTGNGPRVLQEIDMVGSDLGFSLGTCGKEGQGVPVSDAQPTLRIPELLVGGRIA